MNENSQTETDSAEPLGFSIRYEGGDAEKHQIDLSQLGQSLQGMARVLAVSAHFAQTGKYNKQYDALSVKVLAVPTEKHNCFEVSAVVQSLANSKELWSGLGTAVFMGVVGYVFNRRKEQELKHLSEALQSSMGHTAEMNARLLGTIEKLADAMQPSVRQALSPIGQSVGSINIRGAGKQEPEIILDAQTKSLSAVDKNTDITSTASYQGVISELDMLTGSCKVSLSNDPDNRIACIITDPVCRQPDNAYAKAMSSLTTINFKAKAEIGQDGETLRLYISDLA